MKTAAMSVWVFINLLCFGMCGYLYLIWSQYWMYIEKQRILNKAPDGTQKTMPAITFQETYVSNKYIYSFNRLFNSTRSGMEGNRKSRRSAINGFWSSNKATEASVRSLGTQVRPPANVVVKSNGSPRFPNIHKPLLEFDTDKFVCNDFFSAECAEQTAIFKQLLLKEFHRVLMGDSKVFKSGLQSHNPYNVKYDSENRKELSKEELLCALSKIQVQTITAADEPFKSLGFGIPKAGPQHGRVFNTCAVVTSAGALLGSRMGEFIGSLEIGYILYIKYIRPEEISKPQGRYSYGVFERTGLTESNCVVIADSHDMVLRFNNAPTTNFTDDVGSKTTVRVLNSQVVAKPEFNFLNDSLYKEISILIWDPSSYASTLEEWYRHPDFPLFPVYKSLLEERPEADVHLLNPKVLWELWKVLQDSSPYRLRKNPPSSGFIGIWYSLHRCRRVRVFEYVPSARASRRCHYHVVREDPGCTLGAWHPLAQEKTLAERIRDNSDLDVFQRGYIDVPGFVNFKCPY